MLLPLQFSRLQIVSVLFNLTLTATAFGDSWKLWEGEGWWPGSVALWLCFFAWQRWLPDHSCCTSAFSLPGSLGSAVYTESLRQENSFYLSAPHGCRNWLHAANWFFSSPETHSELWSVFVAPISALFPSFLPYLSELTHLQMFQCVNLSDVFVCWERNLWLNYSCLACNFNGWDKGHPLCCHASDVTDYF